MTRAHAYTCDPPAPAWLGTVTQARGRPEVVQGFTSTDPLTAEYPWYSPYQFAGNKPVWAIDVDGLEEQIHQYMVHDGQATLIRKVDNADIRRVSLGQYGSIDIKLDKRTGKPFPDYELGTVQYQYVDIHGTDLHVHRDLEGRFQKGDGLWLDIYEDNYFGSNYIGPDNPQAFDNNGDLVDDYRREPIDMVDRAALHHDRNYGRVGAAGVNGALQDPNAVPADEVLVDEAKGVKRKFYRGLRDEVTGRRVTVATFARADAVQSAFEAILTQRITDKNGQRPQLTPQQQPTTEDYNELPQDDTPSGP